MSPPTNTTSHSVTLLTSNPTNSRPPWHHQHNILPWLAGPSNEQFAANNSRSCLFDVGVTMIYCLQHSALSSSWPLNELQASSTSCCNIIRATLQRSLEKEAHKTHLPTNHVSSNCLHCSTRMRMRLDFKQRFKSENNKHGDHPKECDNWYFNFKANHIDILNPARVSWS